MNFNPNIPPKPKKENKNVGFNKDIKNLARFDTEGFDEYDKKGFLEFVQKNNINVSESLDGYLDNLDPSESFSVEEISYINAFRALLHCDFKNAKEYIEEKFNFKCETNQNFLNKYHFFNTVASLIFENQNMGHETEITQREKSVFDTLKEKIKEGNGSFLLNYLSKDYVSVIDKEKSSVRDEKDIDWVPYQIAPNIYAFDSKNSLFALIHKNNLEKNSMYVSDEKDFEKISLIISSLTQEKDIDQKKFDDLAKLFSVLKTDQLKLNKESKNLGENELFLFRELHNKYHRQNIENETGIDLSKIPLIEQRYFIDYLKFVDEKKVENVRDFNKNFKENGFRAFLSIEQGGKEMGDKILSLGEKLPKELAEKVFAKYGEIVDVADKAEAEVNKLYEKDNISEKVFESVKETLLKKGAEFLSDLGDSAGSINEEDILRELENIKTETMILGSSYLELYRSGEKIPFDEIKGTTVEKISSQNLTEEKKNEIVKAYIKGRPKETYENKEHLELLTNEFSENLNKKETYIFNIRFKGEIIAFATFKKENEDTFHIGGLTFLEDVRNPVVAEAVMNSIMKEFGKYNVTAEVHSKNRILNMYQKRFGFKITGEMPLEENAGELYYKIERPKNTEEEQELKLAA